jgi:hypothetical protein
MLTAAQKANLPGSPDLSDFTKMACFNPCHFSRSFRQAFGV